MKKSGKSVKQFLCTGNENIQSLCEEHEFHGESRNGMNIQFSIHKSNEQQGEQYCVVHIVVQMRNIQCFQYFHSFGAAAIVPSQNLGGIIAVLSLRHKEILSLLLLSGIKMYSNQPFYFGLCLDWPGRCVGTGSTLKALLMCSLRVFRDSSTYTQRHRTSTKQ